MGLSPLIDTYMVKDYYFLLLKIVGLDKTSISNSVS